MSERKFTDAYRKHVAGNAAWVPSFPISIANNELPAERLVALIESARDEALQPFYELFGKEFADENLTFDFRRISSVTVPVEFGDYLDVTVKVHPIGAPDKAVEVTVEFFFEEGRQGPPDASVQGVKILNQYPLLSAEPVSTPCSSERLVIEQLLNKWDATQR